MLSRLLFSLIFIVLTLTGCTDDGANKDFWAVSIKEDSVVVHNEAGKKETSFTLSDSKLPIVFIDTNGVAIVDKENDISGTMTILESDGNKTTYDLTIRGRGNATWEYEKKPYKIKLDKKSEILGMKANKSWVLLANYTDKSLIRNTIANETSRIVGMDWTPDTRFVELVINGEYLGNYQLSESVKEGKNRVPLNEESGFLIENDTYYAYEPLYFSTNYNTHFTFKYPDEPTSEELEYIKEYMNKVEKALFEGNWSDPETGLSKYIDMDSFAKWFLVQSITYNLDTNYYFWKEDDTTDTKLKMGPVWDFEWSLGSGRQYGPRPSKDHCVFNQKYFSCLLNNNEFKRIVYEKWLETEPDLRERLEKTIDDTVLEIYKSQEFNYLRWDTLNKQISIGPSPLGSYDAEVQCDKEYLMAQIDYLDKEIRSWME
ncbi:MAG: CotH kinase family protein [Candidatus Ornithospirochaeta sp.]